LTGYGKKNTKEEEVLLVLRLSTLGSGARYRRIDKADSGTRVWESTILILRKGGRKHFDKVLLKGRTLSQ